MGESCAVCGFVWAEVPDGDVLDRITAGTGALAALLRDGGRAVSDRPAPDTWSPLEYGGHVRDVLLHVRDRVVIGLVEDDPDFKPLYRDERVDLGLYRRDDPATVATELEVAAALFARTWLALDETQLERRVQYGYPRVTTRSIRWMGQQVLHEVEHHLADATAPSP